MCERSSNKKANHPHIIVMTPPGYKACLLLLISGTLIISAIVPCKGGEAAVDTDGNEVLLAGGGSTYYIQYASKVGFYGGLDMLPVNESSCENYVWRAPETDPGRTAYFTGGSLDRRVLELGMRYRFAFSSIWPNPCKEHGVWTTGVVKGNDFPLILTGQEKGSNAPVRWFEVRRTEDVGVYKLAVCPCEFCRILCPEVGSYVVDGKTVLGVGGDSFPVKFVKFEVLATKTTNQ